jgi:hypothetical protein
MTEDEVRTLGKLVAQLMLEANEQGMSIVEIDLDAARRSNVSDKVRSVGRSLLCLRMARRLIF